MNRNYDIGRITPVEFYCRPITRERTMEILEELQISVYDSLGAFRPTSDLIKDLQRISNGVSSFTATRMAIDAMDALINSTLAGLDLNLMNKDDTRELDSFLETFKIVQGGVSL